MQRYEEDGPTLADRGGRARKMIDSEKKSWKRKCSDRRR